MAKSVPARPQATDDAAVAPRRRDRERTLHELNLALIRLQRRGEKVTLKAVADEARVSPPLIHNRYPDFAEQVRAIMGRAVRRQRNETVELLVKEREKSHQLRELVSSQLVEITRLASVNEALRAELALQKAIAEGKVARGAFGRKTEA